MDGIEYIKEIFHGKSAAATVVEEEKRQSSQTEKLYMPGGLERKEHESRRKPYESHVLPFQRVVISRRMAGRCRDGGGKLRQQGQDHAAKTVVHIYQQTYHIQTRQAGYKDQNPYKSSARSFPCKTVPAKLERIYRTDGKRKSYEDIVKDPVCEKIINGHTCKAHGKHHTQIPCWVTGVLASFIYGKRKYGKSEPAYYPQYDQLGKDICAYMIQGHGNGGYDLYLVLAQSKGSGRSHDVIIGPLCPSLYMEKGIPSGHLQ